MSNDVYIEEGLEAVTQRAVDAFGPLSDELLAEMRIKWLFNAELYAETHRHHHPCDDCGTKHECFDEACAVSADFVGENVEACC